PPGVERGDRERGLRVEEMVEAAFLDTGVLADGIHGYGVVTRPPRQLGGRVHQALLGVADSSHCRYVESGIQPVSDQSPSRHQIIVDRSVNIKRAGTRWASGVARSFEYVDPRRRARPGRR